MIAKTDETTGGAATRAFKAMTMPFMRAATVLLCYVVAQVLTLNHFLYTLLKERYLDYQIPFYMVLLAGSLLVSLPWNLSRR